MANPNIVNVASIFGKSTTLALTTTVGTVLLANAASSGKVFKINTILSSNVDGTNDGAVTIAFNTDAGGTGTSTELASTITVPADADMTSDEGTQIVLTQLNTGDILITGAAGVTVYSEGNKYTLRGRYAVASLIKLSANTWLLSGNLVT